MKLPKMKKDISLFLSSEEAKILRKDIVRLGLSAAAIAAIMAQISDANAVTTHDDSHDDSHNDAIHTSHGDSHDDVHDDAAHFDHGDSVSHTDNAQAGHNSVPAPYDAVNRRGGHTSQYVHGSHSQHHST